MSLKDELLKANLISKKQIKQIEHEQRVEHKKLGREGVQEKKQQQQRVIEEQRKEKKTRDQQQAKAENEVRSDKEKQTRIEEVIRQGKIQQGVSGNRKFYFVWRGSKIFFISVNDSFIEKLERGGAAIVEQIQQPSGYVDFVVVNQQAAIQLLALQPDIVCFYQQQ